MRSDISIGPMPADPPTTVAAPEAVLIERNKLVGRRVARVLTGAGFAAKSYEDPAAIPAADLAGAQVVVADAFDALSVVRWLAARPSLRAVLYTATESDRLVPLAAEQPRLGLLGRASFEAPPRE